MSQLDISRNNELRNRQSAVQEKGEEHLKFSFVFLFLLGNIILVILFRLSSLIPTGHALFVLALGLYFILHDEKPDRPIFVLAYICATEVLWRGLHARVFWEFGKYSVIVMLVFMILKYRQHQKISPWGIIYFVLLIPSVFLLDNFNREDIAYSLAGPLALALAFSFFNGLEIRQKEIRFLLMSFIGPSVGLAFLALLGIVSSNQLTFTSSSLYITSAGIGPNQVSSALSVGVVTTFFIMILEWKEPSLRFIFTGVFLWLLTQNVLTFSRGGVWTAIAAIFVGGFYLMRDQRTRGIFIGLGVPFLLVVYFVVFPALDNFTNKTFSSRYADFNLTGRAQIMEGDLIAFRENVLMGVGPGQSDQYHLLTFRYSNTHTEYTRMLAEHGIFGILAILILLGISLSRFFAPGTNTQKMLSVAFTLWALLYMFHSATRTVAPSLFFGLAALTFLDE